VNPRAFSAGAIISLACREIVTSHSGTMGDALPIFIGTLGQLNQLAEAERQKALAPLLAEVIDSARRRGYDEKLVQGIVSLGVELWLIERVDDPSQRLFITRAEYVALFGEEPDASQTPELTGAASIGGSRQASRGKPAVTGPPLTSEQPQPTTGDTTRPQFEPAAPGMSEELIRDTQTFMGSNDTPRESRRPVLSSPDQRGKWQLVQYISDGSGLVTLKAEQLVNFGLAQAKIGSETELKTAYFGATNLARLDMSVAEHVVRFLNHFVVRGILIVLFVLALFIEMTHPGLVLPGLVAACCLVLLIVPPVLVGLAAWWEIAAIILGILLIGMEIFIFPGTVVCGLLGVLLFVGGLVATFIADGGLFPNSARNQSDLTYAAATVLLSGITATVLVVVLAKNFKSLPGLGRLVLKDEPQPLTMLGAMAVEAAMPVHVGDIGVTITPLRPSGRMQLIAENDPLGDAAELIDVVSEVGFISVNVKVRVVSVDGFRTCVEPV
jgi:membrane-bound ClpP family serine protease